MKHQQTKFSHCPLSGFLFGEEGRIKHQPKLAASIILMKKENKFDQFFDTKFKLIEE